KIQTESIKDVPEDPKELLEWTRQREPVSRDDVADLSSSQRNQIERECLDYMIPINERHLRQILRSWASHYNRGRPHSGLGPGIPDQKPLSRPQRAHRHRLTAGEVVTSTPVLGGLHHEYGLDHAAA